MTERPLFTARSTEALPQSPVRPLGPLSDFVVNDLPVRLEAIRSGEADAASLSSSVDLIVESLPEGMLDILATNPKNEDQAKLVDIAVFDLVLLKTVIAKSGGSISESYDSLVSKAAENAGRIPWITYEDLVLVNPLATDPRTLLTGAGAQHEIDFYETHTRIEGSLDSIIEAMLAAHGNLSGSPLSINPNAPALNSEKIITERAKIIEAMKQVGRGVDQTAFDTLNNNYFGSTDEFSGPSGAFSAGFPVIEILLSGEDLPEDRHFYNTKYAEYFPRDGQILMAIASDITSGGNSLKQLCARAGNPPEIYGALRELDKFLQEFRGHHLAGVRNKAAGALEGKRPGTAGTIKIEEFLLSRSRFRHTD